jgi:hypothetical protein
MSDEEDVQYTRAVEQAKLFVSQRKAAYSRVFAIQAQDGKFVLEDLAEFCRAHSSTYDPDPRLADRLDGRREVWLRIQQHLQLTEQQLWSLYKIPRS